MFLGMDKQGYDISTMRHHKMYTIKMNEKWKTKKARETQMCEKKDIISVP
jgi:phosphoribosylformylglycinamidine (FGAM) synthase PurS component